MRRPSLRGLRRNSPSSSLLLIFIMPEYGDMLLRLMPWLDADDEMDDMPG